MIQQSNKKIEFLGVGLYLDYTNSRLKVVDYKQISRNIIDKICFLAKSEGLEKIIVVCRKKAVKIFQESKFEVESTIAGFFAGQDGYFLTYYAEPKRKQRKNAVMCEKVLGIVKTANSISKNIKKASFNYSIRDAALGDIPQLQELYSSIFKSYPTAIFKREYLEMLINGNDIVKVAIVENKIVSVASAEINERYLNAEVTDCATKPNYSGNGLLSEIIKELEKELIQRNIKTVYSLCRATEVGINKSLRNLNYTYQGCLINNCDIAGDLEDMNVWTKQNINIHT